MGRLIKVDFRKKQWKAIDKTWKDRLPSISFMDWVYTGVIMLCLSPLIYIVVSIVIPLVKGKP